MAITPLTFQQLIAIFATQFSSQAAIPANTNQGSTLGAIANAGALMILNVQNELIYIDDVSRAATSSGADVDSFWTPFGIDRYGYSYSSGIVTCSTPSPVLTGQVVVPVGGVLTTSGGLPFVIQSDPTNSTGRYSATFNGYVISGGNSSTNVLVTCSIGGTLGNVAAGQITEVYNNSGLPVISGISIVSNASAFVNGANSESDSQYNTRSTTTISTGVVSTPNALIAALLGVQPGLTYSFGDGVNITGGSQAATCTMFVNIDGTGMAPPSTLVPSVQAALNGVRSAGITVLAVAPTLITVPVSAVLHAPVGTNNSALAAVATTAYNTFVNGIGLNPTGGTTECDYFSVASTLLAVSGVTKIDSLLVNGSTADIVANFGYQLVAGTSSFTVINP